jgi:drug/metabolite transporter (DMT)-like permease
MKATRRNLFIAFSALYIIWGSTYLAIKFAAQTLPPFGMAGLRFLVAGAFMYGVMRMRGSEKPGPGHWRSAWITGALLLGGNGAVVWAEQYVPSGFAAILVAITPIWMVLLNWIFRRERPSPLVIAGLLVGFFGVWYLVRPGATHFNWAGVAALFIASFTWASGSVFSKSHHSHSSAFTSVGMQMLCGSTVLLLISAVTGEWNSFHWRAVSARSVLSFGYLIVFGSLIGFTAYAWLLKVCSVAKVSTYAYINPIVAVCLGFWLAGETLTRSTLIAGGIILVGVVMIQSATGVEIDPDN